MSRLRSGKPYPLGLQIIAGFHGDALSPIRLGQYSFDSLWISTEERQSLLTFALPVFRVQLVREGLQAEEERAELSGPSEIVDVLSRYLEHEDREHFVILMLDVKNRLIGLHTVSIGTLNAALVSPREVFKAAILANAASVVLGHNHPSGDPTPSPEDHEVTERLRKAGAMLDIDVLDHVVVGDRGRFTSLRQQGFFSRKVQA